MIPKLLHFIWVGDENRRPDALIQTWAAQHPGWDVKLWTNDDITRGAWRLRPRFYELGQRDCAALAAAMKWEILWRDGGVVVSADSLCLSPLDESWLRHGLFTHWEHEQQHPGLIGCWRLSSMPAPSPDRQRPRRSSHHSKPANGRPSFPTWIVRTSPRPVPRPWPKPQQR
jgi:mannosyltransferase OCH1-like enzyme